MKSYKLIATILSLLLLLSVSTFAQEEKEMTQEEFQQEMTRLTQNRIELTKEVNELKIQIEALKAKQAALESVEDSQRELYVLVGATEASIARYRSDVAALKGKIQRREGSVEDALLALQALQNDKISALPEFNDEVYGQLQRSLDAWKEEVANKEVIYTVVKGDYLWKIAKKSEFYGNGFAWPVIYNANRDQIKNPDLIYPKQAFKIPNLSNEEKAKYDKAKANYKPAPPTQN
ncbi:MAG: LysM peptidoglycan-binding domain-containing protein [Bacteroidetes bacterium]|nr:LysM peptidoglycan-binding domain-containing protein [Bacteroidota bacterium]MBU1115477.1 LysM peptidoglycan-binding domain-containing protein [Bacteroidota bacterium]MBU1798154.1 LysM peptidoglycan-binding domain-containing protein [Bacteroidota bacterium]